MADIQATANKIVESVERVIVGKRQAVQLTVLGLLCQGHILIEDVPGVGKTVLAKSIAKSVGCKFQRIQFTPDLLPSDLIGTDIYLHETSKFEFRKGPLFHNIILADEINRAPAKVQSALLEAMEEKQVSVGLHTYPLPPLYMVLATQNPIEQEGTYNLPEAQLDRFLMHCVVGYPDHDEEMKILELDEKRAGEPDIKTAPSAAMSQEEIFAARKQIREIYMDPKIKHYAVSLVSATRKPGAYSQQLYDWILHGASPRATLGLVHTARALAWLEGDGYVAPHHIQQVAPNILRHRIIPTFEAEAGGVTRDRIVAHLLEVVAVP